MNDAEAPARGVLRALAEAGGDAGAGAYLVGGAVRDRLLSRRPLDLDVAYEGPLSAVTRVVSALERRGFACEARHERFGTATLREPGGLRVDVATTREEEYAHPGALPRVTGGAPIGRDLARRDFSIHAMAIPIGGGGAEGELLDPFGGREDLDARRIRLLHGGSLADDPTRVFRAARYAARLGFALDPGFDEALRRAVASGAFARVSGDRLRRAFQETLQEENRDVAVEILVRLGVPGAVVPGWGGADAPVPLSLEGDAGRAWKGLLAPLPPAFRCRVADRLSFSGALRRESGCGL